MKPPSAAPVDVADAAQDRRRERLQAGVEAEVELDDAEVQALDDAGRTGERRADEERHGDRLVDVDAHQLGGLRSWAVDAWPGRAGSG